MPVEHGVRHWPPLTGIVPVPALLTDFRSLLHCFRYAAERLRVGDKRRPLRVSFARLPSAPSLDHFCGHSLKRCAFDGLCNGSRTDLCGVISVDVLRLAQSWCVCHFSGTELEWMSLVGTELVCMFFAWHRAGVDVLWLAQSWRGCPLLGTELQWLSFAWHRAGVDVLCLAQSWRGCHLVGTELAWMSLAWHRAMVGVAGVDVLWLAQSWCGCSLLLHLHWIIIGQNQTSTREASPASVKDEWTSPFIFSFSHQIVGPSFLLKCLLLVISNLDIGQRLLQFSSVADCTSALGKAHTLCAPFRLSEISRHCL